MNSNMEDNADPQMKSLVCVEFPGKVQNVDRAIQCLGGLNKISQACTDPGRLECRFRPDNHFCKPAIADRIESQSFLLKVMVKKKRSATGQDERVVVRASVCGKVEQVFKFYNLNDFQYLPMEQNTDGKYRSIYNDIVPKPKLPMTWECDTVPFYFPPTVFCRHDSIQPYLATRVTEESTGVIGRTRDRRSNYVKFVSHDMKDVPTHPVEHTIRYIKLKFVSEEQIQLMKKLFSDRPAWTKSALECVTRYPEMQLKYLLALNAYHFTSGPFRIAWVRFGYDPRKDPSARKYQILDYRVKNSLLFTVRERLPDKYGRGRTKMPKPDEKLYDPFDESHYKFKPGFIPPQKQMFYQVCDIEIPEIQEKLKNFTGSKCYDQKNGWLTEAFLETVRNSIDQHVLNFVTCYNGGNIPSNNDLMPAENDEIKQEYFMTEELDFNLSDPEEFMDTDDL